MENQTVKLNVSEVVVVHVRLFAVIEDIVVKDLNQMMIQMLAAVLTLQNGQSYQFIIQNGDVLRHLVDLLMIQLMNLKYLMENSAFQTMIIVFCSIISHSMTNQISDLEV